MLFRMNIARVEAVRWSRKLRQPRNHLFRQTLASISAKSPRAIVATGRFIGEGFDDARLDTLFLAMPFSLKGTIVQYSGRLQRAYPEKTEIQIYDYLDSRVLVRMFERRVVVYRSLGYELAQR